MASRPDMDRQAYDLLMSMYHNEPQLGAGGERFQIDENTRIPSRQGMFMHDLHRRMRPALSLEIGLGYGFSTVFLLAAMKAGGYGHHIAIDPFQNRDWNGVGVTRAEILGMSDRFSFIEEKSITAVPKLIERGTKTAFVFIDGNHRFDDVLVDFYLCENVCELGGVIIFDDLWMPSVQKVVAFIRGNRDNFEFLDSPLDRMAIVRKIGEDGRPWDHYADF